MALLLRSDIDMHGVVLSEFVVGEEFITDIGTLQSPKTISSPNPRKEETKCSLSLSLSSSSPVQAFLRPALSRRCIQEALCILLLLQHLPKSDLQQMRRRFSRTGPPDAKSRSAASVSSSCGDLKRSSAAIFFCRGECGKAPHTREGPAAARGAWQLHYIVPTHYE